MSASRWVQWHEAYDDPSSALSRRLTVVQQRLRDALEALPAGGLRLISACAGEGRDVIGVLDGHLRADDVSACLVESDPVLVGRARELARRAGLAGVDVVESDAGAASAYDGYVPADIVLLCGVFGNISDDDIHRTIAALPSLCASGAHVLWTRHRRPPDRTPAIRTWLEENQFEELRFISDGDDGFAVGAHRFTGRSGRYRPEPAIFAFTGDGSAPS